MTENTTLWDKLGKTDPSHTKTFKRAGGFSGTAIKPMWSYRRMTEEFGACGTGWGINEPSFQVVPGSDGEILVYCTVSIWYSDGKPVFGVGGDKVVVKQTSGLRSDDEAFKKAYTDAVTNALKMIGVGADVHMGLFDDSKYVNDMRDEFSDKPKQSEPKKTTSAEQKRGLEEIQRELIDCRTPGDVVKLLNIWAEDAQKAGWSKDYWDAARRLFAQRKKEIESEDDFPGDKPNNSGIRDGAGRQLSNAEAG